MNASHTDPDRAEPRSEGQRHGRHKDRLLSGAALLVLVVLLPWCCTAAGFARGGGATLRGVPRFKNSHGRRPSIHGEGEPPKVGEPRRGAPVADRFAALRFSQVAELPTGPNVLKI